VPPTIDAPAKNSLLDQTVTKMFLFRDESGMLAAAAAASVFSILQVFTQYLAVSA